MSETTSTVEVGGHVLVVGDHAGTRLEPDGADGDTATVARALEEPGVGAAAEDFVDALSEATGRIEKAKRRFEAVADGRLDIAEASDLMDGAIGLLERLDREGRYQEAVSLARALNGLFALARRWVELVRSLNLALGAARRIKSGLDEAWVQHELGTLNLAAGDRVAANRRLSEAQWLRRELGDSDGLAATQHNLRVLCRGTLGTGRRVSRRLLAATAALLLLLAGAAGGAFLAPRDDEPPGAASIGEIAHLTVETEGPGTVTSRPAGIDCPERCEADLAAGTEIVLRADPDDGARFEGWSGACSGMEACELRPRRDRTVVATFREAGTQEPETATLAVDPPANGTVTSTPEGIDCGDDCSEPYEVGETVELEPTADDGYRFTAWGNDCTGGGACSLTMGEDRTVSATFTAEWTITVTVTGEGTVESSPAGITCTTGECSATFLATDGEVVLTASGGAFEGWGGDCEESGRETTCTLPLDADHDASAAFSPPGEP